MVTGSSERGCWSRIMRKAEFFFFFLFQFIQETSGFSTWRFCLPALRGGKHKISISTCASFPITHTYTCVRTHAHAHTHTHTHTHRSLKPQIVWWKSQSHLECNTGSFDLGCGLLPSRCRCFKCIILNQVHLKCPWNSDFTGAILCGFSTRAYCHTHSFTGVPHM